MAKVLKEFVSLLLGIGVYAALTACGTTQERPPAIDPHRVWPPPPYQSSLKFLGVFSSANNFAEGPCAAASQTEKLRYPISSWPIAGDKIFVVERTPSDIKVIDFPQRNVYPLFDKEPPFSEPVDLAGDSSGNLYIADRKQQQVLVLNKKLKLVHTIGATLELKALEKLILDEKAGVLYLTDSSHNEGFAFDLKGTLLFRFGAGLLTEPHGLAIHPNGNLYVADTGNAKIRIFNPTGEFQEDFPIGQARFPSPLKKPWDLAFDPQGLLYIVDQEQDALLTCRDDGELLFATGTSKRKDKHLLGFHAPSDIHIDPSGQVFIADRNNFRLSVWQLITNTAPTGFFAWFGQNFSLSCQEYEQNKTANQTTKRPSVFLVGDAQNVTLERVVKKEFEGGESRDAYKEVLCLGSVKCKNCMSFNNISVDTEHIEYVLAQMHRDAERSETEGIVPAGESSALCRKCQEPLDLSKLLQEKKIRFCLEPREICPSEP